MHHPHRRDDLTAGFDMLVLDCEFLIIKTTPTRLNLRLNNHLDH